MDRARARRITMDNSDEFVAKDLRSWFTDSGIIPECFPPYCLESFEQDERLNRTLLEKERAKINPLNPDVKSLCADAVATDNYITKSMLRNGYKLGAVTLIECLSGINLTWFTYGDWSVRIFEHLARVQGWELLITARKEIIAGYLGEAY